MKPPPKQRPDYLVVGSGFFGGVFARVMAEHGLRSLVIDRRPHLAGNCYTQSQHGIEVHQYGPHIFHTSDERVWKFVNRFAKFHHYIHRVVARYGETTYSFPINLKTLEQLWGVRTPEEAAARLQAECIPHAQPQNCEEWLLANVGRQIYETFFEGYTTKQWNRSPAELPASIVRRIPIRLADNDRYFDDRFEGIPIGGYTRLFENLLDHPLIEIETGVDYLASRKELSSIAPSLVYSGAIDEFFDYRFGALDYRSLRFVSEVIDGDYQTTAIVNYTSAAVPFTRITEHKHFAGTQSSKSVITREYPDDYAPGKTPYYPVRDPQNVARYEQYRRLSLQLPVIFGGRLGSYQYFDMHQVIAQALSKAEAELALRGQVQQRRAA